ncbi:transposase [Streptomyces sp. NEAU-174]|uniref:transposase n=1 Tax=Streptomyces sp. NEAU-174 TaxID=3458254 RepID=UPI0040444F99
MVMKVYSPEFKVDAVALYHSDPDLTIAQVARDLGIRRDTLRRWIDAAEAHHGTTARRSTKDEPVNERTTEELEAEIEALREQLKAVRKENATLASERDILRKATKFFASEMHW